MVSVILFLLMNSYSSVFIDNGIKVENDRLDFVVNLSSYISILGVEVRKSGCTATLLSPRLLITAAHCLEADLLRVSKPGNKDGGDNYTFGYFEQRDAKVIKKFVHSRYKIISDDFDRARKAYIRDRESLLKERAYKKALRELNNIDIGFAVLDQPIVGNHLNYPKISTTSLMKGDPISIVGYGKPADTGSIKAGTRVTHDVALRVGENRLNSISNGVYKLIRGGALGNSGDSGGPLFHRNDFSIIYGIASTSAYLYNDVYSYSSKYMSLDSDVVRSLSERVADFTGFCDFF